MTTNRSQLQRTMKIIETPASNDVLCGKDKTFNRNIGNMTYRQLIVSTALEYSKIKTKPEKMRITAQIVHTMIHIHHSRFLKQVMVQNDNTDDSSDNEYYWQEISITAARDKTSHALRFCAAQMQLAPPKSINHNISNYRFTNHDDNENYTNTATSATIPVTPTTPIRRSIRGRVQRKAKRYSPTTSVVTVPMTTAVAKRKVLNSQQPIQRKHHRRTVSSENSNSSHITQPVLSPMIVGSSSSMYPPSPYHGENTIPYYYPNDYDQYQNYYHYYNHPQYDPYTTAAHHRTNHGETPVPMECSSSTTFVPVVVDASHSMSMPVRRRHKDQCDTRMQSDYHNTSNRKLYQNRKEDDDNDDEEEDDLDAILREPIQWEEDVIDDDDDDDDDTRHVV